MPYMSLLFAIPHFLAAQHQAVRKNRGFLKSDENDVFLCENIDLDPIEKKVSSQMHTKVTKLTVKWEGGGVKPYGKSGPISLIKP